MIYKKIKKIGYLTINFLGNIFYYPKNSVSTIKNVSVI